MVAAAEAVPQLLNEPDDLPLRRGERAPFSGILTSELRYRYYAEELQACGILKEGYVLCEGSSEEGKAGEFWPFLRGGIVGAALAVLVLGATH